VGNFRGNVSSTADYVPEPHLISINADQTLNVKIKETHPKEEKMKQLPQVLFWLGLISIPFAWLVWYVGPQMEMVRPVLASISDPALRAALQEAHAERLGIWVAVWPVTLLVLSQILEWKIQVQE
jgi:hypothetical protein